MLTMIRMRTAKEAYEEILKADPDTAITLRAVQRIVKQGKIPITPVGRKRLLNLDTLIDYFDNPDKYSNSDDNVDGYGTIRAIH